VVLFHPLTASVLAGDIKAGAEEPPRLFVGRATGCRSILEASATSRSGRIARRRIARLAVGEVDGRAVAHAKPHAFAGVVVEKLDPGLFKSRS